MLACGGVAAVGVLGLTWWLASSGAYNTWHQQGAEAQALQSESRSGPGLSSDPEVTAALPDFSAVPNVNVKKQQFLDFLYDYIAARNTKVAEERKQVLQLQSLISRSFNISNEERALLQKIASDYNIPRSFQNERDIINELAYRVDEIPVSLALAQAATESAWGTSRFALEGFNIFGQWCYREGCGMVPARRPEGALHEVRVFENVMESVDGYFMNINTHPSYRSFRNLRANMRQEDRPLDSIELAYGLIQYSERGDTYVVEIQTIIQQNHLKKKYDN